MDEITFEALNDKLQNSTESERESVLDQLAKLRSDPAIQVLITEVMEGSPANRRSAVKALGRALRSPGLRSHAKDMPEEIDDTEHEIMEVGGRLERWYGQPLKEKIDRALIKNGYPPHFFEAENYNQDEDPINPLIEALQSSKSQRASKITVKRLSVQGAMAVDSLIEILDDDNYIARLGAAEALGQIGDQRATEPLIELLEDDKKQVRETTIKALASLKDSRAVLSLLDVLNQSTIRPRLRTEIIESLGEIGDSRATELLINTLQEDDDSGARGAAAKALGGIGDHRAFGALSHALRYDDATFVRSYAVYAMANIGGTLAVDILVGALNDPDLGVRGAAALQLGKLGDPRAIDALIIALDDPDDRSVEPVRMKAARALGEIGDSRAFDALRKMSQRDPLESVRRVATESLRKVHTS